MQNKAEQNRKITSKIAELKLKVSISKNRKMNLINAVTNKMEEMKK